MAQLCISFYYYHNSNFSRKLIFVKWNEIAQVHVFVKHYAPGGNKVRKKYIYPKGQSRIHMVINLEII